MGLLDSILEKLGFSSDQVKAASKPAAPAVKSPTPSHAEQAKAMPLHKAPPPMATVDVVAKLEAMAKQNPQDLNWKRSIVDLLKLLGIDSSFEARKQLAMELHAPPGVMDDSAQMNTWLHKMVMRKVAENGGNVPKELLD